MAKSNYTTGDERLDAELERFIRERGAEDGELIRQMITTALKLLEDKADRGDLKIMNTSFKEIRYFCKVFAPYRRVRKVSLFGSARSPASSPFYQQALEFSQEMARRGYMIITGAGHGIMEAGNLGAGREMSFGVNIQLPFEQVANEAIANDRKLINFKYFFTRKLAFLKETHAVVCCPGGFGTHDEGFEALTLIQTGKSHLLPLVFLHPPEMLFWNDFDDYIRERLLHRGMISPEDLSLYLVTSDAREACDEVSRFYRRYHSMRYVNESLVVRMEAPLQEEELAALNDEFADLLVSGGIGQVACALPEEHGDQPIAHLPRLVLHFRRRSFGRLRQMVDRINGFPLPPDTEVAVPEAGEGGVIPDEAEGDDPEGSTTSHAARGQ